MVFYYASLIGRLRNRTAPNYRHQRCLVAELSGE